MSKPVMIALMGAPNSGKSKLADELSEALDGRTLIIDNYAKEVEDDSEIVLGVFGTYFGDLAVTVERIAAERRALAKEPEFTITCGTLIESVVYGSLSQYATGNVARTEIVMRFMGLMMYDFFGYDHLFLLEPSKEPSSLETQVYDELCYAIDNFGFAFTKLNSDPERRCEEALAHMKARED